MNLNGQIAGGDGFGISGHLTKVANHLGEGAVEFADLVGGGGGDISDGEVARGDLAGMGDQDGNGGGKTPAREHGSSGRDCSDENGD